MSAPDKQLSHVNSAGEASMVDVGAKALTERVARARGSIKMRPDTLAAIRANSLKKGDVLAVARVAGILAAKRTPDLIPLCHPIMLGAVDVSFDKEEKGVRIIATARTNE